MFGLFKRKPLGGDTPPEFVAKMLEVAQQQEKILRQHFDIHFDYSESSLEVLDDIISGCWSQPPKELDNLIAVFGSYLGETIRLRLGGRWVKESEKGYFLTNVGNTETQAFPFVRMRKRFLNGIEDSLAIYFAAIRTTVSTIAKSTT